MSNLTEPTSGQKARKKFRGTKWPVRWVYGVESDYYMIGVSGGNWTKIRYSHDVPHRFIRKGSSREFSATEKIRRLQELAERRGRRTCDISTLTMDAIFIIPKGGKVKDAVSVWRPVEGWHVPQPFSRKPSSAWRLWMAKQPKNFTFSFDPNDADFQSFSRYFPVIKPDLVARFVDTATGELPTDFIIAAYLGQVAKARAENCSRAYLYRGDSREPALRIDLGTGAVCGIGDGSRWVSPTFFSPTL